MTIRSPHPPEQFIRSPAYMARRLINLGNRIIASGDELAERLDIPWPARMNSTVAFLASRENATGIEISKALGISPQLIGRYLGYLKETGVVISFRDKDDARCLRESLTPKGRKEFTKLQALEAKATAVFAELAEELGVNLNETLGAFEQALDQRDVATRILDR